MLSERSLVRVMYCNHGGSICLPPCRSRSNHDTGHLNNLNPFPAGINQTLSIHSLHPMRPENRDAFRRQLGLRNSSWRDAGPVGSILGHFNDPDLHKDNYIFINRFLLHLLFEKHEGIILNREQRSLWALNVSTMPSVLMDTDVF